MCAGAVINSRIRRLVYGAYDPKAGSCSSVINLFDLPYNHRPEVTGGFMREECSALLSDFFEKLRSEKKEG
jgi:tRNA(adenine34) deaminase